MQFMFCLDSGQVHLFNVTNFYVYLEMCDVKKNNFSFKRLSKGKEVSIVLGGFLSQKFRRENVSFL